MSFVVCYLTDSGDLYSDVYSTHEGAMAFIETCDYKCILISCDGAAKVESHT